MNVATMSPIVKKNRSPVRSRFLISWKKCILSLVSFVWHDLAP